MKEHKNRIELTETNTNMSVNKKAVWYSVIIGGSLIKTIKVKVNPQNKLNIILSFIMSPPNYNIAY